MSVGTPRRAAFIRRVETKHSSILCNLCCTWPQLFSRSWGLFFARKVVSYASRAATGPAAQGIQGDRVRNIRKALRVFCIRRKGGARTLRSTTFPPVTFDLL